MRRPPAEMLFGAAVALVLAAIGLRAEGGSQLGPATTVELGLELAGGVLAAAALLATAGRRVWGGWSLAAFGALALLTGASLLWAIQPSDAWLETNRTVAYLATFAAGVALVRLSGAWWAALLGGVVAASAIVCGWALATKVFPGALNPDEIYARLREPYGYWNAVGLTAAIGIPGCLWLGARRHGHAAATAAAYPVLALLVLTILLAYSRGSLLAAVVGCAAWFTLVPLRLRGAVVLAVGVGGALPVAVWAFGQEALTQDRIDLALRTSAGHELGLAIAAMVIALGAAGLGIGFFSARRPPAATTRRTAGAVILATLALVPIGFLGVLALSDEGLGGSLSSGWRSLTDPDAATPPNEPGRLTAVGSVRARYWNEAIKIFKAHKLGGVGAGGYATARPRYRNDNLDVRHAHGYVVQQAADLGAVGLLVSAALFVAWLAAALRSCGYAVARAGRRLRPVSSPEWPPERVAMVTLLAAVTVFGVHSFVDWTLFVPGTAIPALLLAGWLAGRGPAGEEPGAPTGLRERLREGARDRGRAVAAGAIALLTLTAMWATWQPLRSVHAGHDALAVLDRAAGNPAELERARDLAQKARERNPLSIEPLLELAAIETAAGRKPEAQRALEEAVRLQPSNSVPWLRLAEYTLHQIGDLSRTLALLGPALHLDPRSDLGASIYLEASRRGSTPPVTQPPAGATP